MAKLPSMQFYPGDWRKDQNLSRASKAAKGVYMDIICLAFECEKRGVLQTGKKPWSIEEIAYAVGGDMKENISCIQELLTLNILKIDSKNAIFQSRMVKDEKIRKARSMAGLKGGNPLLVKQKDKQTVKQNTTPSSSSSSSSSSSDIKDKKKYKKKFRANIELTDEENAKIIKLHTQAGADAFYDFLSDYKIEKGYKTKSDYLTILRWVVDAVKKKSAGNLFEEPKKHWSTNV